MFEFHGTDNISHNGKGFAFNSNNCVFFHLVYLSKVIHAVGYLKEHLSVTSHPCLRNSLITASTASKEALCQSPYGKLPHQLPAQQPSVRCNICTRFLSLVLSITHCASSFSACSLAFDCGIVIIVLKFIVFNNIVRFFKRRCRSYSILLHCSKLFLREIQPHATTPAVELAKLSYPLFHIIQLSFLSSSLEAYIHRSRNQSHCRLHPYMTTC